MVLREHDKLDDGQKQIVLENIAPSELYAESGSPEHLGIHWDGVELYASYYIGAAWLSEEKDEAVAVLPKVDNLDFMRMFAAALSYAPSAEYFSEFYGINFGKKEIECKALEAVLSPLLIVHYLRVLEELLKAGLRKGYIIHEENLKAKVRGRIVFSANVRQNTFRSRDDRVFCRYQEYTPDTPENRLLKRALVFSKRMISAISSSAGHRNNSLDEIAAHIQKCMRHFEGVGDNITLSSARSIKLNKLYRHYNEALPLAKKILRMRHDSLSECSKQHTAVREFWIDMTRLYEVYVYSMLEAAYPGQVKFQAKGSHGTACDFIKIDEKIILDAKYKERYANSNKSIIDDIRQLSGYARDEKILKALGVADNYIPPCVIIYPEPRAFSNDEKYGGNANPDDCIEVEAFDSDKTIVEQCGNKISGFKEFYKIAVQLPEQTKQHV